MARKNNMNLKENPVSKVKGVCAHSKDLTSMPATHGKAGKKKISFSALECLTYPMPLRRRKLVFFEERTLIF